MNAPQELDGREGFVQLWERAAYSPTLRALPPETFRFLIMALPLVHRRDDHLRGCLTLGDGVPYTPRALAGTLGVSQHYVRRHLTELRKPHGEHGPVIVDHILPDSRRFLRLEGCGDWWGPRDGLRGSREEAGLAFAESAKGLRESRESADSRKSRRIVARQDEPRGLATQGETGLREAETAADELPELGAAGGRRKGFERIKARKGEERKAQKCPPKEHEHNPQEKLPKELLEALAVIADPTLQGRYVADFTTAIKTGADPASILADFTDPAMRDLIAVCGGGQSFLREVGKRRGLGPSREERGLDARMSRGEGADPSPEDRATDAAPANVREIAERFFPNRLSEALEVFAREGRGDEAEYARRWQRDAENPELVPKPGEKPADWRGRCEERRRARIAEINARTRENLRRSSEERVRAMLKGVADPGRPAVAAVAAAPAEVVLAARPPSPGGDTDELEELS